MGVTIDFDVARDVPFSERERASLEAVMAEANVTMIEREWESLGFYAEYDDPRPQLCGAVKMPMELSDLDAWEAHVTGALTRMRRTVPDAEWRVAVYEEPLEWDEIGGYTLPGASAAEADPDTRSGVTPEEAHGWVPLAQASPEPRRKRRWPWSR